MHCALCSKRNRLQACALVTRSVINTLVYKAALQLSHASSRLPRCTMSDMESAPSATIPRPSIRVAPPSKDSFADSLKKGSPADSSPCDGGTQDVIPSKRDGAQKVVLSKEEDDDDDCNDPDGAAAKPRRPGKIGRVLLPATTIVILAWWASSLILPATRHRWYVPLAPPVLASWIISLMLCSP